MAIFHLVWAAQFNEDFGCRRGIVPLISLSEMDGGITPHPFRKVMEGKGGRQDESEPERENPTWHRFRCCAKRLLAWPRLHRHIIHTYFSCFALSNRSFSSCIIWIRCNSQQQLDEVQQMDEMLFSPCGHIDLNSSLAGRMAKAAQSCTQNKIFQRVATFNK